MIESGKPDELAALGRGKVRATTDILEAAMDGELSARHRLVLDMAYDHLRYLEGKLAALDRYLLTAMQPYAWAWRLLQTIPGIDAISAAMILIEIGDDPHRFGSPARLASWSALCPGNNELADLCIIAIARRSIQSSPDPYDWSVLRTRTRGGIPLAGAPLQRPCAAAYCAPDTPLMRCLPPTAAAALPTVRRSDRFSCAKLGERLG